MNDNKKYEESLGKAFKEAVGDDLESLDFYKDLKYIKPNMKMYKAKNKSRNYRYIAVAASFMIIFMLSSAFAILISNGTVDASKFRLEQQLVKLKNILISENQKKYREDVGNDHIVLEIKSQDEIKRALEFFPDLFVSDKIPERFSLDSLTIYKLSNGLYKANYVYKDVNGSLLTINQESIPDEGMSTSILDSTNKIKTNGGTIYVFENPFGDGANAATYLTDFYIIDLNGMIEINEITDILNK